MFVAEDRGTDDVLKWQNGNMSNGKWQMARMIWPHRHFVLACRHHHRPSQPKYQMFFSVCVVFGNTQAMGVTLEYFLRGNMNDSISAEIQV